jgi:F-type H+-transporting ATPase subunit alpha
VSSLNQGERQPLAVEDQVLTVYAATNGFLDRVLVDRVPAFLTALIETAHAHHKDLRKKIAGGDWSDETQEAAHIALSEFAEQFGYDLDEEGQPIDEDAPPPAPKKAQPELESEPQPESESQEAGVAA